MNYDKLYEYKTWCSITMQRQIEVFWEQDTKNVWMEEMIKEEDKENYVTMGFRIHIYKI
jgi:hypothetical protein